MKSFITKRGSTLFLRGVVVFIGGVVLAFSVFLITVLLKNDLDEYTLIVIGMLLSTIPAFGGLYFTLKLLNYIDNNLAFSQTSIGTLKHIKYCAIALTILCVVTIPFFYYAAEMDDAPGVLAINLVVTFASIVIATFAAVCERILKDAIEIKSENDLTV